MGRGRLEVAWTLGKLKQVRAYSQLEARSVRFTTFSVLLRKGTASSCATNDRRGWGRPFDEPIEVDGRKLVTLRDAGEYIAALPKKEHAASEWQAAMQALILVAESGGPTMLARIGVMRALNRHYVPELNPKGKEPHWGRRKLKRDE